MSNYARNYAKFYPKRIRVITMDVTGTIVSFRGTLTDHYLSAARQCGVTFNESDVDIENAFNRAYKETSIRYPCFGGGTLPAKDWWRICVMRSFDLAGVGIEQRHQENVFQRIYSRFGSQLAYGAFQDAVPFLNWANRQGVVCGVASNADERYGDNILPMLGYTHENLKFMCFSKDLNVQKPDVKFFSKTMKKAELWLPSSSSSSPSFEEDPLLPSQVLHIGNDFEKDFEGAQRAGMFSLLLDRYGNDELSNHWKRRGAPVYNDLLDVVAWIGRTKCRLG